MKASRKPRSPREPTTRTLAFDPTPAGLVAKPLRKYFKYLWECLREEHFKAGDFSCEICNVVEKKARLIHAHEVYSFLDPHVVKLERIAFICTRCHDVIHFERSRSRKKDPYRQALVEHYCKVNGGISEDEFWQDVAETSNAMLAIRKLYGGAEAKPSIVYGPFQSRVDELLKRRLARGTARRRDDEDDEEFEMFPDHECPWDITMGKL